MSRGARRSLKARPFKTVDLKWPIAETDGDVAQIRIYRPKMGDIARIADTDNMGVDDIIALLERLGRDGDGKPLMSGWASEIDPDDFEGIGEVIGGFFGSGETDPPQDGAN